MARRPLKKKSPASRARRARLALAFDLGGTKLAAGVVSDRGEVLSELREPTQSQGRPEDLVDQIERLARTLLARHKGVTRVGIASAGPLDPRAGVLLDPTNFGAKAQSWGQVPLAALVQARLKKPVRMENDAAAAMRAEAWVGSARGLKNAMVLTLGTGLGTGMICNGALVRGGRHLHPEAGHLILSAQDREAPCGCGNLGCAEAYLSGRNFERRAQKRLREPGVSGADLALRARNGELRVRELFEDYAQWLAVAVHNYVVLYYPESVILTGGFAYTADLFLESARTHLLSLLQRRRVGVDLVPRISVSSLHGRAGLIGGGWVAFFGGDAP